MIKLTNLCQEISYVKPIHMRKNWKKIDKFKYRSKYDSQTILYKVKGSKYYISSWSVCSQVKLKTLELIT